MGRVRDLKRNLAKKSKKRNPSRKFKVRKSANLSRNSENLGKSLEKFRKSEQISREIQKI